MTPTARSLNYLRRQGWLCGVVERWNAHVGIRQDLWGFADLLAIHPRDRLFLIVQSTTKANLAARVTKIRASPEAFLWRKAGGLILVHGWFKNCRRWDFEARYVTDIEPEPRPRRRSERQKQLF